MTDKHVLHFVGYDGERAVGTAMTQQQIDQLKSLRCDLVTDSGEPITWADFDNPDEPRTVFRFILSDNKKRVDERMPMANQPPFGVATVADGACVRFEFYEGYHALMKTHDLRSEELQGVELDDYIDTDEELVNGAA